MSGRSLIDQIRHYQKDIERCPENKERMIRCIQRLYVLPILVQHLQETGVGRSVNSLRKYDGEVGNAAKALVAKWKAMVAAEEAAELEQARQREEVEKSPDPPPSDSDARVSENGRHKSKKSGSNRERSHKGRDEERSSHKKSSHRHHNESETRQSKRRHSDESDSSPSRKKRRKNCVRDKRRRHSESASESEIEDDSDKHSSEEDVEEARSSAEENASDDDSDSSGSSSDHRHRSKKSTRRSEEKSRHKSASKRNSESEDSDGGKPKMKDLIKEIENKVKKERHESSALGESSQPSQKNESVKNKVKVKLEKNEDGIDGTSGFSFADALLGAESTPKKKKKKPEPSKLSKSDNLGSSSSKNDKSSKSHSSSSKSHQSSSSKSHHSSSKHSSSKAHHSSLSHHSSSSSANHSSSNKKSDKNVPDLLKHPIKVENLDFDINSTLPEITPNYKPLPHVPDRKPHKPTISDEDHMFNLMTTKNQRTKVFSGAKYGAYSSVPSLYSLCIQVLYENVDAVEYTGGVPYDILKPLLHKLNSDQLYVIEHFNPYLIEDTDTLWEFHCKKDFRNEKRQDMESWRDLYLRCMDEREKKLKALTANINESIAKSTPVRTAKLAYVDSLAKPPRNIARKQAKYGTGAGSSTTATTASLGANTAQKQEILSKAIVGANTPGVEAPVSVPAPSNPRAQTSFSSATVKKKKAPLMAKALQLIKGNRFKR